MNSNTHGSSRNASKTPSVRDMVGMFCLAFATLLFELVFNKVVSVQHYGSLGYVVIGTALFGFAFSGVLMACNDRLRGIPSETLVPVCALIAGLTMLLSYLVTSSVPLDFTVAFTQPITTAIGLIIWYIVLTLPFFFAGLAIVSLLGRSERGVSWLYGADLIGAGLGAFLSIYFLAIIGGAGALWSAGLFAILSAALFARNSRTLVVKWSVAALLASTVLGLVVVPRVGVIVHTEKRGYNEDRDAGKILKTKWSSVSRIDVADRGDHRMLWFDGGSMQSHMFPGGGKQDSPKFSSSGVLPYLLKPRKSALILASSGGKEVFWATSNGTERVTAVELDPVVIDMVSEEYNDYLGGLFNKPNVELINAEGRSFIKRSQVKYDVIQMVSAYSVTMLTTGAAAGMDSYLVTKESIRDYYDHLTDDGVLYISRENGVKLFLTVLESLEEMGVDPANRIYLEAGFVTYNNNAIMLRKTPFPRKELEIIAEHATKTNRPIYFAPAELYAILDDRWQPEFSAENYRKVIQKVYQLKGDARHEYVDSLSYHVIPATDDKPFFNRTTWYLSTIDAENSETPWEYQEFAEISKRHGPIPIGDVPALAVLAVAVILAGVVIFWPLRRLGPVIGSRGVRWLWPTYFAMLGIGFIAIEVILLQRYILFVGTPPLAVAVVLGSLLGFAGLGSAFISPRVANAHSVAPIIFLTICALVAFFAIELESIFSLWLGYDLITRCILGVLLLAPLGLLLGVPFPIGLRLAHHQDERIVAWGWALNGYATVIGTTATSIIIQFAGYQNMFLIGGSFYLVAGLCFLMLSRRIDPVYEQSVLEA